MLKSDTYVDYSQNNRQDKHCNVFKLEKLTCIQDIAMSPARSSVVSMIPNQNTARTRKASPLLFGTLFQKFCFHYGIRFLTLSALVFPCSDYLNMFAVVASCWKLYSPEGDWTFEGNLNGRLLHAVLSVERRIAR